MAVRFEAGNDFFDKRGRGEYVRVEAWGANCIRVRATAERDLKPYDWALEDKTTVDATVSESESEIVLTAGKLSVSMDKQAGSTIRFSDNHLRFFKSAGGETLLEEKQSKIVLPDGGRHIRAVGASSFKVEARFAPDPGEKFYGLGHNQQDLFNLKGSSLELRQMNTHTVVPVVYSSKGYGFFWNNPAYGRVELVNNGTYWMAEESDQIDYFVFNGDDPKEIMGVYARLTGHPSMMPEFATGFWQSKLRYQTQDELLAVAREYRRRGLPLSVIVIDFFHWPKLGDFDFDPECWPDPQGMIRELKEMGIETMVSVWPMVNAESDSFSEMLDRDMLVRSEKNLPVFMRLADTYHESKYLHVVDFMNPDAGEFVWSRCKANYYERGVRAFWLDECEPETRPYSTENMRYHLGNGAKVSSLYPLYEERVFYEGMKAAGEELPVNLCRSAWAGSQKFGAVVWSGDVLSDFETLRGQIKAGLNSAMAGIPWWTTDIGGFFGGNIHDSEFKELLIRWFQWGAFSPVFRLHGNRLPKDDRSPVLTGAPNEVWSYGEQEYEIMRSYLFMRERIRGYIGEQMAFAHRTGVPPMRPLFFDYPEDKLTYDIDDAYLFGPDILAAPVTEYQQRSRDVYLPAGESWIDAWTDAKHEGGDWITVAAPIDRIPLFLRDGASVPLMERGLN